MKALFTLIFTASLTLASEWTTSNEATLDSTSQTVIPGLKSHTVLVGRLGLSDIRPAVVLSKNGDILAPLLQSIDSEDEAPYLLYQPDGSRQMLKLIAEKEARGVAHLKATSLPQSTSPASRAPESALASSHWFLLPITAAIPYLNEPIAFARDHAFPRPNEDAVAFSLSRASYPSGTPVFDLAGRLLAIQTKVKNNSDGRALTLPRLAEDIPSLVEIFSDPIEAALPKLPLTPALAETDEEDKEEEISPLEEARDEFNTTLIPSQASPFALVFNDGKAITHSIGAVIVRTDGLLLTKASELGPNISVRHGSTTHPAVLLATDESTDLALIGIEENNLPVIEWHTSSSSELKPGSSLISPLLLQETSEEMSTRPAVITGAFSHLLSEKTPTLHTTSGSSSGGASLGIVTEQAKNKLIIASLSKDSPAEQSDLKPGDQLLTLNGEKLTTRASLSQALAALPVGQEITLSILQNETSKELKIKLTRPHLKPPPTGIDLTADLTLIPSIRRYNFPQVLVHTMPLDSWDCGTPLYNLQGQAIGLNISANSLYRSYALPPEVIKAALKRLLSSSKTF